MSSYIDPDTITDEEIEKLDFFDQVWVKNYRQAKAELEELAEKRKHRKPKKKATEKNMSSMR